MLASRVSPACWRQKAGRKEVMWPRGCSEEKRVRNTKPLSVAGRRDVKGKEKQEGKEK
jgi:hypothetical protein